MKVIIVVALFFVSCQSLGSKTNCNNLHDGNFRMIKDGYTTIIKRKGNYQYEYFRGAKKPTKMHVIWMDACTYKLKPDTSFFVKYPEARRDAELIIHITKTTPASYTAVVSGNFLKDTSEIVVDKIK